MNRIHCIATCLVLIGSLAAAAPIDPKKAKADPDGKTVWYDAQLFGVEGKGWTETEAYYDRLPAKAKGVAPRSVWNLSKHSAGMCVPFTTDARSVQVRWVLRSDRLDMPHMPATGVSGVDLYGKDKNGKWRFLDNGRPKGVSNRASFKITPGQPCLLFLPLYNGVKSVEIGIPPGKKLRPLVRSRRKPIVIYGTSITQGACASRPGMAFPAIIARELETPVINLGFSGSGKMEPEMADLIAELDPSIFVLDCIRNMSVEMTQTRIEPFVKKLRAAHPDTPIVLAEEADFRDNTPTAKGRIVRESYERLKEQGIKNLHLLSTKGMLGADHEGTVDKTHPNDLGMMRQAKVFIKTLWPILKTTDSSM